MTTKSHRSTIAVLITILMVIGGAGSAVAGLQACPPKACCCMKSCPNAAPHMLKMDTKSDCTGDAPCCRVEPVQQAQKIAALASTPELPEAKRLSPGIGLEHQTASQMTPAPALAFQYTDKPRASLVPIYLQTQMLLC